MNAHDTAFPVNSYVLPNGQVEHPQYGMSQRTYIATSVLSGLLSNPGGPVQANPMSGFGPCNCGWDEIVGLSVDLTDRLISKLNKPEVKEAA